MNEKYYTYRGQLELAADADFFKVLFKQRMISYELRDEIKSLLSEDESLELVMEFPEMPQGMLGMMISKTNLYVNIKVSTIVLIALVLDIEITKGVANAILTATGFNANSIIKLNEKAGEKCVLLEIYRKQYHEAGIEIFDCICGKECVNNDLKCKYRDQGICTMSKKEVINILEEMVNKNVFSKREDVYKYNF